MGSAAPREPPRPRLSMRENPRSPSMPIPRPADVPYNDWHRVALPAPEAFKPSLPVSVVMPCHRTPPEVLARTLAALEGQTYPRDLFELLIVDDGSEPPLQAPRSPLNLRMVRQARRGFGIARARNTGVRAAAHDIILFLDGDSLAEAEWMAAHARWHHSLSDVLTLGFRTHVSVGDIDPQTIRGRPGALRALFADRQADPPWVEPYMLRTNDLRTRSDDLFWAVVGGNFGIGREFYWSVGGSDESFARWGLEETEFAWRAYTQGALLAPVRAAFAWHQGRWTEGRDAKRHSARIQRGKVAHLIAHPSFRDSRPGRIYRVPRFVVTIGAGSCPAEQIIAVVGRVLADRIHDLVVRIDTGGHEDEERLTWLCDAFGPDPRVRVAPARSALEEFPAAAFHVRLPATVLARNLVHRLYIQLGGAVMAIAPLPDGTRLSIARSWALHRARRTGRKPEDFGEFRMIKPARLRLKAAPPQGEAERSKLRAAMAIPAKWKRLLERTRAGDGRHSPAGAAVRALLARMRSTSETANAADEQEHADDRPR